MGDDWGRARLMHAAWKPHSPTRFMHISPADDREEVDIETANDPVFTAEQIGWRFALGALILVGAYAAWPLIPVVMMTDLDPGAKAGLSGLLGATPFMSKFVALAIMGRPAYYFLKRNLFTRIRRWAARPAE
jgi:hypothetical protein